MKIKRRRFKLVRKERDWTGCVFVCESAGAFETSNEINKGAATNCDAMFVNIH